MGVELLSCYTNNNIDTFLSVQKRSKRKAYFRIWNLNGVYGLE
jgi:hypothetical protein